MAVSHPDERLVEIDFDPAVFQNIANLEKDFAKVELDARTYCIVLLSMHCFVSATYDTRVKLQILNVFSPPERIRPQASLHEAQCPHFPTPRLLASDPYERPTGIPVNSR